MARVQFHNTGPEQIPGLIVMSIADTVGDDLDPARDGIVVLFNASPETQTFTIAELAGTPYELHPIQQNSADVVLQAAGYDVATGTFTVPGRTTAVFQAPQTEEAAAEEIVETAPEPAAGEEAAAETPPEPAPEQEREEESPAPAGPDNGLPIWLGALLFGLIFSGFFALLSRSQKNPH